MRAMIALFSWVVAGAVGLTLCVAAPASGQVFYGVSGGFGFAGPGPTSPGFLAEASLGHRDPSGSGWRVDAFAAGPFQVTRSAAGSIFSPCGGFCFDPIVRPGTISTPVSVGVAGLALDDVIPLHASSNGTRTYAIVGGEVDHLLQGQGAPQNILFGASPGVGIALAPEGRQRTFLEARVRGLVNSGGLLSWMFLISAGHEWSAAKP